jgi:molecular chaperone GrpE
MSKKNTENSEEKLAEPVEFEPEAEPVAESETPSTPSETQIIEALQSELTEARLKAEDYLDGWQRSRAEFSNYKKRIDRDQAQTYQQAAGTVIKQFLGIMDDLERALKTRPNDGEGAAWANGIELVYRKLVTILENEGLKTIPAEGLIFDPNVHEAIILEDSSDHESGQVIEVLQQGYLLGDKVLRPARVRVAR